MAASELSSISCFACQCRPAVFSQPCALTTGVFNGDVPVTTDNILGAASLIIWTITAIPVIKYDRSLPSLRRSSLRRAEQLLTIGQTQRRYALIVLRADDNGQGRCGCCMISHGSSVAGICTDVGCSTTIYGVAPMLGRWVVRIVCTAAPTRVARRRCDRQRPQCKRSIIPPHWLDASSYHGGILDIC